MRWSGTRAMSVKEFRQLRRDRRTVALLVFQPLVLLLVFGYAANYDVQSVPAAVIGPRAEAVAERLPDGVDVRRTDPGAGREDAVVWLRAGEYTAVVLTDGTPPVVLVDGSELFAARSLVSGLAQSGVPAQAEILFNPDLETPPVLVPALAGIILAFVGTIATSLGVVRERQAGTIEQLAVMPLQPADVLAGKVVPYLLVAVVDLALVMTLAWAVFDVPFDGSVAVFGFGALLFLIVTLGLGLLVSTVSENQGQAMQLAFMVTLPQVLLSGALFPIDTMPAVLRGVAYVLPLTWFVEIARGVMLRGASLADLATSFAALAALAVGVFGLAIVRVRRDLLPAGAPDEPDVEAPPAPVTGVAS